MPNHWRVALTVYGVLIDHNSWSNSDDLYIEMVHANGTATLLLDNTNGMTTSRDHCNTAWNEWSYALETDAPSLIITHTGDSDIIVHIYISLANPATASSRLWGI